jgi:hypothetical protein
VDEELEQDRLEGAPRAEDEMEADAESGDAGIDRVGGDIADPRP